MTNDDHIREVALAAMQAELGKAMPEIQGQLEQYVTTRLNDFRPSVLGQIQVGSAGLLRLLFVERGHAAVVVPSLGELVLPLDETMQSPLPSATTPGGLFTFYVVDVVDEATGNIVYLSGMDAATTGVPELTVQCAVRTRRIGGDHVIHELLLRNFAAEDRTVDVLVYRFAGLGGPIG